MRNLIFAILSLLFLISCDPDVPGEGVNLPEMKFGFKISPETACIKLGDTLTISAVIPSNLGNGIKITDGKATINFTINQLNEIPLKKLFIYKCKH